MDLPSPPAFRHRIWYGDLFPMRAIDRPTHGRRIPPPPPPNILPTHPPPTLPLPPLPNILPTHPPPPPPPPQEFHEERFPIYRRFDFSPPQHVMSGSHLYETRTYGGFNEGFHQNPFTPGGLETRLSSVRVYDDRRGITVSDCHSDLSTHRYIDENRSMKFYRLGPDLREKMEHIHEIDYDDRRQVFASDCCNLDLFGERHFDENRSRRVLELEKRRFGERSWESSSNGHVRDLYNRIDMVDQRWFVSDDRPRKREFGGSSGLGTDIYVNKPWNTGSLASRLNVQNNEVNVERDHNDRRWNHGFSDHHRNRYTNTDVNDRKWDYCRKPKDFVKGRLGCVRDKELSVRSKKWKLKNIDALNANQPQGITGCGSDLESPTLRQKEREEFMRAETEGIHKKESEHRSAEYAIPLKLNSIAAKDNLYSSCSDVKFDLKNDSKNTLCTTNALSSPKSIKKAAKPNLTHNVVLQSDFLEISSVLLDKVVVSGSVKTAEDTDLFENPSINGMNFPGQFNSRKKRRLENQSSKSIVSLDDHKSSVVVKPLYQKVAELRYSGSAEVLQTHASAPHDMVDVEDMRSVGGAVTGSLEGSSDVTLPDKLDREPEKEMILARDCQSDVNPTPIHTSVTSLENATSDQLEGPSPPYEIEEAAKNVSITSEKVSFSEKKQSLACPPFPHSSYSKKYLVAPVMKSRTWHRSSNSSDMIREPKFQPSSLLTVQKTTENMQSTYMRKGNSLVRKPIVLRDTASAIQNPVSKLSVCSFKHAQPSDSKIDGVEKPEPRPLKYQHDNPILGIKCSEKGLPCQALEACKKVVMTTSMVPNCKADSLDNLDCQCAAEEDNSGKEMKYIKRKRYQLVAASNSARKSLLCLDKSKATLSNGYFKSKENQLVRKSSGVYAKKRGTNISSSKVLAQRNLSRPSNRRIIALSKAIKYSNFSLVWKLHDKQSPNKHKRVGTFQKVLPRFLPWKKSTYLRSCIRTLYMKETRGTVPTMSKRSLASRKRDAMYIRSSNGYSLRMSRFQSIYKSGFKWLNQTEKNSENASEENVCAISAAEENNKDGKIAMTPVTRNFSPREQIFLIGSERYKMNPTRRTLQRISAELESSSSNNQPLESVALSFVPRGLPLDREKYVRIGKGNQLVRDLKKRTRVLASEKIRWSLHTARLRLARKKKFCQFFTRYGKCNKDDGKCPYIHDPSKIVICTKFLSGSCSNPDCKLTHKVIPERMQDCSYFLKGSCSNDNCPYRHVHLNPNSTVCESFLRGYCANGNECPKKHTYVCPAFESTGACPGASTCKLHHPKKKTEKTTTPGDVNIVRGRYFDGGLVAPCSSSSSLAIFEKVSSKGKYDSSFHYGKFPDYISLDVNEDEEDQSLISSHTT